MSGGGGGGGGCDYGGSSADYGWGSSYAPADNYSSHHDHYHSSSHHQHPQHEYSNYSAHHHAHDGYHHQHHRHSHNHQAGYPDTYWSNTIPAAAAGAGAAAGGPGRLSFSGQTQVVTNPTHHQEKPATSVHGQQAAQWRCCTPLVCKVVTFASIFMVAAAVGIGVGMALTHRNSGSLMLPSSSSSSSSSSPGYSSSGDSSGYSDSSSSSIVPSWTASMSNFTFYSGHGPWTGELFVSADVCLRGNGGIRGLGIEQCLQLCLLQPACRVTTFYPVWFGGPSACFAMDSSMAQRLVGPVSSTPLKTADQGSYLAGRMQTSITLPANSGGNATAPIQAGLFSWWTGVSAWTGEIFGSPNMCKNGNTGMRGLSFAACLEVCLLMDSCRVVVYHSSWYKGASACFARDASMVPYLVGVPSVSPVAVIAGGQPAYIGYKI